MVDLSSAKIGIPGVEYAYVGDRLAFGEETPEYLRAFYTGSFDRLDERDLIPPIGNPTSLADAASFPVIRWRRKEAAETGGSDNPHRKKDPKPKC